MHRKAASYPILNSYGLYAPLLLYLPSPLQMRKIIERKRKRKIGLMEPEKE